MFTGKTAFLTILTFTFLIYFQITPATAQQRVQDVVSCSNQEQEIPASGQDTKLDISVKSPFLDPVFRTCKLTFSTESATSEENIQFAVLSYASTIEPLVGRSTEEPCTSPDQGPVLIQVQGGVDETHTFINFDRVDIPFPARGVKVTYTPCLSSALGSSFRIRRHCMILQCN